MIYHSEKSDDESTTVSFYPSITIWFLHSSDTTCKYIFNICPM
jgi:hypothetical protein